MVGFRVDSCESTSKCGTAPEIPVITALNTQIKNVNQLIEHFRSSCDM